MYQPGSYPGCYEGGANCVWWNILYNPFFLGKVPKSTPYDLVTTGDELKGRGRKLRCMTPDEESKIVAHVKWRASVGCGLEWRQLQSIIQEILLGVRAANPDRINWI